jgi:O-methyltransferase
MIGKVFGHIRNGTLAEALLHRVNRWLGPVVARKRESRIRQEGIARFDIRNREEAIRFLSDQGIFWSARRTGTVIVSGAEAKRIAEYLTAKGTDAEVCKEFSELPPPSGISCIICADFSSARQFESARQLNAMKGYQEIPFEYVARPTEELAPVKEFTSYDSLDFVSPLLLRNPSVFDVYRESLSRFEMKCEVRDFMDLCQAVDHVIRRKVPGDVCEFGSFRGHSGYLIARLLETGGSDKTVHLFDTFDRFPEEIAGVDTFWSGTHEVEFEKVRMAVSASKNIRLVKGDFTETFRDSGIDRISFVHVDCDSYRATRFLTETIFEKHLSPGGIMLFEDYGHASLLGNRMAVHEFFDSRTDCFTFFSQFSGCYLAVKA